MADYAAFDIAFRSDKKWTKDNLGIYEDMTADQMLKHLRPNPRWMHLVPGDTEEGVEKLRHRGWNDYLCPDNKSCRYMAVKDQVGTKNFVIWVATYIVVFGMYLKVRPSFSSYFIAIPFHLGAFFLLTMLGHILSFNLLGNDTIRAMFGMCKTTEGLDWNNFHDCVPLCENRNSVPVDANHIACLSRGDANCITATNDDQPVYQCIEDDKSKIYDGYVYRYDGYSRTAVSAVLPDGAVEGLLLLVAVVIARFGT